MEKGWERGVKEREEGRERESERESTLCGGGSATEAMIDRKMYKKKNRYPETAKVLCMSLKKKKIIRVTHRDKDRGRQ